MDVLYAGRETKKSPAERGQSIVILLEETPAPAWAFFSE